MVRAIVTDTNGDVFSVVANNMNTLMESIDYNYIADIQTEPIRLKDLRQGKEIFVG